MRAIGYREFFVPADNGSWELSQDLDGVQALIAQNSRRYAKRQITFFAGIPNVNWIECGKNETDTVLQVRQILKENL